MYLVSNSFRPYDWIPARHAFGQHDPDTHFATAGNVSPALSWGAAPEGTRSFVVLCVDPDVPTRPDDVNQEGREVPQTLPRTRFYHWILVDLPAGTTALPEGAGSDGVTPRGKPASAATIGRTGVNDYTGWFAGDPDMGGTYTGYDGPAPPWNDSRVHGYHFQVFALDVPSLDLPQGFTGADVERAMQGHVLDQATLVGLYAINPAARARHRGADAG